MAARDYAFEIEVDDSDPICTHKIRTAGGRSSKDCGEVAEHICGRCGRGLCAEHESDFEFYMLAEDDGGDIVCEDCVDDEEKDGASLIE
jgi:hypothetical protein